MQQLQIRRSQHLQPHAKRQLFGLNHDDHFREYDYVNAHASDGDGDGDGDQVNEKELAEFLKLLNRYG